MKYCVSYIIMNSVWDLIIGNELNQSLQPLNRLRAIAEKDKFIQYLFNSIRSLLATHMQQEIIIRIWLVEIDPKGWSLEYMQQRLEIKFPDTQFTISIVNFQLVAKHLEESRQLSVQFYRSPNAFHEFLVQHIIENTSETYLALIDCDILFLQPCLAKIFNNIEIKNQIAASFIESPQLKMQNNNEYYQTRERMHTVALFVQTKRWQNEVNPIVVAPGKNIVAALHQLKSKEAQNHFIKYWMRDSLALVTEYLRGNFSEDRLLNLSCFLTNFHQGMMLSIYTKELLHCKYFDQNAVDAMIIVLKELRPPPEELNLIKKYIPQLAVIFA